MDLRPLHRLAERQHGLVSTRQLRQLDVDGAAAAHLLGRGLLAWHQPGVLRVAGSPTTLLQRLCGHTLAAGRDAALASTTALAHWSVRSFTHDPVCVVRHRDDGERTIDGVTIHEVRALPEHEVRVLDGVRVVTPGLALLQFAGLPGVHPERVGRAIDAAWSDRLVSYRSLDAVLARMSQRGRPGLRLLRELVQARGPEYVPPASNVEARFASLLTAAGLPEVRRQVDSGDGEGWIGRVDFRAVDVPLVVEVQSERFHRGLTAEADDHRRLGRLRAAGFVVIEVTDVEVFHHPQRVVERVAAAFELARRRPAA